MGSKTIAVMVTYNPDQTLLANVVGSLAAQVNRCIVVDNSPYPNESLEYLPFPNLQIIPLGENTGIAYAQNIGIRKALENGADYILLSDQDTLFPANYVESMLASFPKNQPIATMAPLFKDINQRTANTGFIQNSLLGFKKIHPTEGLHDVLQTIASGLILNTHHLSDIGLMDEPLFIDWVDLEWCWRARSKGYKILGNADVTITHQLGDTATDIGFREVNLRSPLRHYYITRNAFHLALRCSHLSRIQRIVLFLKSFRYLIGYPVLSKPHLTHLRYVLLGFWHGIIGRLGKLQ